jgi:hypothetical protein
MSSMFELLLTAVAGSGVSAAVVVFLAKRWLDHRLQRDVEHLRRDLSDTLAQRTRRSEYLRGQIVNLYGPLGFLVESSARCFETNHAIMKAYSEHFTPARASEAFREDMLKTIDTANRYVGLVVQNNKKSIELLGAGWGWLDADDIPDAGQYLADVARHNVEFEEKGRTLPLGLYGQLADSIGPPVFIRLAFVDRIRQKLIQKQSELAGLSGAS